MFLVLGVLNWTHYPQFCLTSAEKMGRITSFSLLATLSNAAQDAVGPIVQPVEVPVKGSATIWFTNHSFQFCIICRLAEDALCPIIQAIIEDVKSYWLQY